jgi:hypothetical protein
MPPEEYDWGNGITAIVFFRPKVINDQEDLIYRIEFRGPNSEKLKPVDWSAWPRTRQQADDELDVTIFT